MNLAPTPKPLLLTPRDEEILASVYRYRFVTSTDIAYLLFRPSYMPYVRSRLTRLSGGNDLEENAYLCRFRLHATRGNPERIFTLGAKGRERRRAGLLVVERERRGAVISDDVGEDRQVARHRVPERNQVVGDVDRPREQQRHAARHHRNQCQLALDRDVSEETPETGATV